MLRIRDVYPGSDFFHPGSRIRIEEYKYFNPKNCFLSSRNYDPGCSSRILIFYPLGSRGQKGTGSRIRIRNTASTPLSLGSTPTGDCVVHGAVLLGPGMGEGEPVPHLGGNGEAPGAREQAHHLTQIVHLAQRPAVLITNVVMEYGSSELLQRRSVNKKGEIKFNSWNVFTIKVGYQ